MLAATIKAALICFTVQTAGSLTLSATCWDERLSGARRNGSCTPSQPFVIFGHGKSIHRMGLDGKNSRRLAAGTGNSILIDFHYREEMLFWADRRTGVIYEASVHGTHRKKLYSSDKRISGLAVDWIGNHLYWTSSRRGEIKKMDINGKSHKTILRHLSQPGLINVEPIHRFLFWLSGGTTSEILRCDLSGQMKMTLVKLEEQPKALSVDREDRRLFWVQTGLQGESVVGSCDYNGNSLHIMDLPLQSDSLGMAVFLENIYYTDAAAGIIKRINKYTGGPPVDVNNKPLLRPPEDLKVVHPLMQPLADTSLPFPGCRDQSGNCVNVCSRLEDQGVCQCAEGFVLSNHGTHCEDVNECAHWNHGCSLGCKNIPGSYFCTCPKGYTLLPDRKTCQEIIPCDGDMTKCGHGCVAIEHGAACVCPEGSVLREDGHACTGCSSADRGGCSQLCTLITPSRWQCGCLPGYRLHQDGKRCMANGPPAFLIVANLMDVRRMNPDGTEEQTLVKEPRGTILALDYDPGSHSVYFASTSQGTIERLDLNSGSREIIVSDALDSPEGLAVDWVHRRVYWTDKSKPAVDCTTLEGLNRKTIVKEGLGKPRGIVVHPQVKRLFWTDTGAQPVIESATLEGSNRVIIASTGLVSPTGLTIDFTDNRLFWCDQKKGMIEMAALDGSDRLVLIENQVGRPFDLAVFEDRLWISEWEHQQIRSVHKRTGQKLQRIHGSFVHPASVVVVHPLAKPGGDACLHLNGGCSQECESNQGFSRCSCLPHFILSADGKSCLSVNASNATAELAERETTDPTSKNKTLYKQSTTPTADSRKTELRSEGRREQALSTDEMNADQKDCYSLQCAVNARCMLDAESPYCFCREGFTGDGQTCLALETTSPRVTSQTTVDVTTRRNNSSSAEKCPPSHDAYCLYHGACFYFSELESYACNCVAGYLGERCQFIDLQWLELQRTEREKERSLIIGACMVGLISLISITACITYCFRTRRLLLKHSSVDNVSEISVTDVSTSEATTASVPQFYMVTENDVDKEAIQPHPGRAVCQTGSTETGSDPLSKQSPSMFRHDKENERTMLSAAITETFKPVSHHLNPSLSSSTTDNSSPVKPKTDLNIPSQDSSPS